MEKTHELTTVGGPFIGLLQSEVQTLTAQRSRRRCSYGKTALAR
jgi:hypothetical protein